MADENKTPKMARPGLGQQARKKKEDSSVTLGKFMNS